MKNNFFKKLIIFLSILLSINASKSDEFNFNVTEIEIINNGNIFKGLKRGTINTNDGISLDADTFEYDKISNILTAKGNIKIKDSINNYIINSDKIIYFKNDNIINTIGNSKAININENLQIESENFEYNKSLNKIIAEKNVIIQDKENNTKIFADKIIYLKKKEKIETIGKTRSLIETKYDFNSSDVIYLRNINELSSKKNTTIIDDNLQFYKLANFKYLLNQKELKGEKILITTNYNLPNSDTFYFSNAIINLNDKNFIASDTKINIHKNIFSNKENDPRIFGVSSRSDGDKTIINKGIFTSCKENDKCSMVDKC